MPRNTIRPTSIASSRYFDIATSPTMKEPRSAPQRSHPLRGADQPAGGHQDLLEMLAVDREDQHALDHKAKRAGYRHRGERRRRQQRQNHPQRDALHTG